MPVLGLSYRRRVFDHSPKMPCEVVMNAKSTILLLMVSLMAMSILACGSIGGGSDNGSSGGDTSKSSGPLELLPDDTTRLEVLKVGAILGGSVPEDFEEGFEARWESYSLGDDIVTIDDVSEMVQARTRDGGILMLSGSQIDFAGIRDWLTSDEGNIEKTSYQGEELWGDDSRGMVLLDGYVIHGDTEALKTLLKVKARGEGSLNQASENALKKAYEDARAGWYVLASENCDEFDSGLRSCEGYSITGGQGEEDYLVNVAYRFRFRSEQRAESQALDIEDWLDDRGWDIDLDEVKADGTSVEARASGDEEDFRTEWLVNYRDMGVPPPLPKAETRSDSRDSTGAGSTSRTSPTESPDQGATSAPTATLSPSVSATPTLAPAATPATDISPGQSRFIDACTNEIYAVGMFGGGWKGPCPSRTNSNNVAHYYMFRLDYQTHVNIELVAHSPDADIELLLLQVHGNDAVFLDEDYGHGQAGVEITLPAGVYTIEAATSSKRLSSWNFNLYVDIAQ